MELDRNQIPDSKMNLFALLFCENISEYLLYFATLYRRLVFIFLACLKYGTKYGTKFHYCIL
jgi:hypothetical protein